MLGDERKSKKQAAAKAKYVFRGILVRRNSE
jgi:hypothetical protein